LAFDAADARVFLHCNTSPTERKWRISATYFRRSWKNAAFADVAGAGIIVDIPGDAF